MMDEDQSTLLYKSKKQISSRKRRNLCIGALALTLLIGVVLAVTYSQMNKEIVNDPFLLLEEMINTESISGSEEKMGELIENWLKDRKWIVTRQYVEGNTFNVFAHRGNPNPRLIINSHMDTVPPFIPFSEDEDNIYGRGACDAKGSIVTQLIAVTQMIDNGELDPYDIGLLYVVQEETTSAGIKKSNELGLKPQYLIVGEPTEGFLAEGHKGGVTVDLSIQGKASHSGYPELGVSAITPMIEVLQDLEDADWPEDDIFGASTLNIGQIECGVARNVVPDFCNAYSLIRTSVSAQSIADMVVKIVDNRANISLSTMTDPFKCDVVSGFQSKIFNYGTDLPHFIGNHKSYLFGPGTILVAHTSAEKLNKQELLTGISEYKRLIVAVLNQDLELRDL